MPARAEEIREHHDIGLEETEEALRGGAETTYDVVLAIWGEQLGFHERRFALVETISHLERLERLGRARGRRAGPLARVVGPLGAPAAGSTSANAQTATVFDPARP